MKRYSYWWDTAAPDFVVQPQLPLYEDIVIIGAGFAGISTAYWLVRLAKKNKKNYKILVLDEAPHAAFKSSGRMTGSIYLGSNKYAQQIVDELGHDVAKKLFLYSEKNNRTLESIAAHLPCGAEFNGGFRMASSPKEADMLQDSAKLLHDWGFYPVLLDHDQSQHVMIMPLIQSSLFIPREGIINPFHFTNEMARVVRKHIVIAYGARVKSSHPALEDGAHIVLENGHAITANHVIHTSPNSLISNSMKAALISKREHGMSTTPLSEDLGDMPLPFMPIEINYGLDSLRINDRSLIMIGGKSALKKKDPEIGIINDNSFNQRILDHLDSVMMRNFPISNHTDVNNAWTYVETESRDGLPIVGEIGTETPGHYIITGFGRNKFGLAFLAAKNLAEKILKIKSVDQEYNLFSPKRFTETET